MFTKDLLKEEFYAIGVRPGDVLFVHSAYSTLGKAPGGVEGGPATVNEALLELIGPEGTLIMPTFNLNFLKGEVWDIRNSPSQMGIMTELVRLDPRAKRMFHPIYSVAAIGKLADEIAAICSTDCFGETTIYKKLLDWKAKVLVIGLPYGKSLTFLHHCEQVAKVHYRYLKEFSGVAIDEDGRRHEITCTMNVRDVNQGIVANYAPIGDLIDQHVASLRKIGLEVCRLLDCQATYDYSVPILRDIKGPGLTYVLGSTEKAMNWIPEMKPISSLKEVLGEILPLHRTLASDGMDQALEIIGSYLPASANYKIESFAPGSEAWTWRIPERYVVRAAYLESEDGQRILDFNHNPLHLVSYSPPFEGTLTWDELAPHLYTSEAQPDAIPWKFKYYERDWGFCLPKTLFDSLSRSQRYHACIDASFDSAPQPGFKVATALVHPPTGPAGVGELFVMAHTCHPNQANDDAAGVVTAIEVARRLAANPLPPGSMSVHFWFGPETIGTIAYLANHEDLIPEMRGGIFIEMTGNDNNLALQHSRQGMAVIDKVGQYVLRRQVESFREGAFAEVIANDERVLNGPGLNIPTISLSRSPYLEYHTSADNLSIIHEEKLQEAADVIEEIIRIYATNKIPKRNYRGPVFLSGHGLFVDWQENWALNRAIEKMTMRFEGEASVFEIVDELGLEYWETRAYIDKFWRKNLIEFLPMPKLAEEK